MHGSWEKYIQEKGRTIREERIRSILAATVPWLGGGWFIAGVIAAGFDPVMVATNVASSGDRVKGVSGVAVGAAGLKGGTVVAAVSLEPSCADRQNITLTIWNILLQKSKLIVN